MQPVVAWNTKVMVNDVTYSTHIHSRQLSVGQGERMILDGFTRGGGFNESLGALQHRALQYENLCGLRSGANLEMTHSAGDTATCRHKRVVPAIFK
jgi:hypothetical protein